MLKADTPEQWQAQIGRLFDDDAYRAALGSEARRCAAERYAWSPRMAPLVELCRQLTGDQDQTVPAVESVEKKAHKPGHVHVHGGIPKHTEVLPMPPRRAHINWFVAAAVWILAGAYAFMLIQANRLYDGQYLPFLGVWNSGLSSDMQNILHMPAMALLMVLVSLALSTVLRRRFWVVVLSLMICIAAAFMLEKMQGGIAGRQNRLSDVLVGAAGIALGLPGAMAWRWPHYRDSK